MFHDISKLGLEIYFLGLRITIRHVSGESFQVVLHFGIEYANEFYILACQAAI